MNQSFWNPSYVNIGYTFATFSSESSLFLYEKWTSYALASYERVKMVEYSLGRLLQAHIWPSMETKLWPQTTDVIQCQGQLCNVKCKPFLSPPPPCFLDED